MDTDIHAINYNSSTDGLRFELYANFFENVKRDMTIVDIKQKAVFIANETVIFDFYDCEFTV